MKLLAIIFFAVGLLICGFVLAVATIDSIVETEPIPQRTEVTITPEHRSLALSNRYSGIVTEVSERPLNSPRTGTITRQSVSGLEDGSAVLHLDDVPIIAVVSDIPFWRDLVLDTEGPDVESLEHFLARFSYLDDSEIDGVYDSATESAVERWRRFYSIPDRIDPGPQTLLALSQDAPHRLETLKSVGDYIFEHELIGRIVSAERSIVVSTPVGSLSGLSLPYNAVWRLPGSAIEGSGKLVFLDEEITVADSGLLVQRANVEIDDQELSHRLPVGSPLDVIVTTEERENVLTVPIGLLVTDNDGQSALLVTHDDRASTLERVEVGLVAEGYVEILTGVDADTQIVVPLR